MKVMLKWPDEFHNEHMVYGSDTVFTSLEALECLGHYTADEHWGDAVPTKTERRPPGMLTPARLRLDWLGGSRLWPLLWKDR